MLRVESDGGIATITLDRPERLNAWTTELERAYDATLRDLAVDAEVRAAIVTGAGRGYSAGWDMGELREVGDAGERADDSAVSIAVATTLAFPKPLIAAINGACAGLGLAQALACDVRFAADGAKFTTSYTKLGLVAEDGTSVLLRRAVGYAHALDLQLSSRIVPADEALRIGLVSQVVPADELLATARAYASDLVASCSPAAIALTKEVLAAHENTDLPTALRESRALALTRITTADFREGVASFGERRPPRFDGLSATLPEGGKTT